MCTAGNISTKHFCTISVLTGLLTVIGLWKSVSFFGLQWRSVQSHTLTYRTAGWHREKEIFLNLKDLGSSVCQVEVSWRKDPGSCSVAEPDSWPAGESRAIKSRISLRKSIMYTFFIYIYSTLHSHPLGIYAPHVHLTEWLRLRMRKDW